MCHPILTILLFVGVLQCLAVLRCCEIFVWPPLEKILEKSPTGPPWKKSFRRPCLMTRLDEVYPNVFIALRIMLNSPDAVASPERSFSKLKLIKTFNRSYMTDLRLSSSAMLSIEASCVLSRDLDDVIKLFACQKARSKPF